jgi:hypothetical protein
MEETFRILSASTFGFEGGNFLGSGVFSGFVGVFTIF